MPQCFSLDGPSILWTASGSSPYESSKSTVVAKMLSGRYRTAELCRHWSKSNSGGFCLQDTCHEVTEDLEHILVICPAYHDARNRIRKLWLSWSSEYPGLCNMIHLVTSSSPSVQVQFILTPWAFDGASMLFSVYGIKIVNHMLYLTRTYAYALHKERLRLQGLLPKPFLH